ncbi:transforming growth factor beta receptor type 3-like isoform X2 [Crotalus tigris]|uniref:transforming growth factor beta receptor type 3-like isoform X2 n=1 Tax=Crotalus tigris TaxID=88082 RepID=UPI00192F29C7|nr:transforming growth factor beta receptor type 3-like isoform X2 [Crotalus tigris]
MCGSYQPAGCLWRWCLLFALWTCAGTVTWHHLTCLPESASTSQPILGFREVLRRGKGCISQGLSSTGQEVHVISLRKGRPAKAQVTLMLAPNLLSWAPIFVLHSQQPVQWMLSSSPGKNWTFQVSLGSSISAPQQVVFAETDFPDTARGLLKWASRNHGGVTSLAEYRGVNTIYTRLGPGGAAQATCKLRRNFLTPKHFASERQLQPLRICQNPDPPQDLEVHIILSKGVAPRTRLAHLTVELHAVGRSPRQGLLLILKSERAAQWMVRVHCFTGQLHVLASHNVTVSNPKKKQPFTVIQHTLPELANAKDPLQYAAEQKLPAFTSYTEAERVNRFLLVFGLNEAIPVPPENHELFGPMFLPASKLAVERQHFPEAVTKGWEKKPKEEDSSVLTTLPTAETEKVESDLCYGFQKPMQEKKDIKQTFSSEAKKSSNHPFQHGDILLSLEVSSSEAFVKQLGFCIVSANSRVFVEASLITYHFCLGFTIQQCFISASSDSSVVSSYLLIQHSCAADSHVTLSASEWAIQDQALPPRYRQRQRLSFVLQPRSNDSIHFLHCRLTLCSREQHDSRKTSGSIPKCQFENKACRREEPASGDFQRTFTKPIMVTMETPLRSASPGLKPANSPAKQQGKMKDARKLQKAQIPTTTPPVLELPAVTGLAFSAFIIGISLTGGLWFMHSQTRKMAARKRAQLANEKAPEETAVSTLDISSALNVTSPADSFLP